MNKYKSFSFLLFLKGLAMGIADLIPGISGGTIAFITGIYEDLLSSIKSINLKSITSIPKHGFNNFFKRINGYLLISVLSGIFFSIIMFSNLISHLMDNYYIPLFSFFLGLILSSTYFIIIKIKSWNIPNLLLFIFFILFSYYVISILKPTNIEASALYLFISGFIAIIAMIMPGISGSFILLILGSYDDVLNLIKVMSQAILNLNFQLLYNKIGLFLLFLLGVILGLKTFSNLVMFMIKNYKNKTIISLVGFILGSMPTLWPWKKKGINCLPMDIENNFLYESILFFILGILIIVIFDFLNKKFKLSLNQKS